jgi:chromosome segregation ATPase
MSKGNALSAAKARIKTLEVEALVAEQVISNYEEQLKHLDEQLGYVSDAGCEALKQAGQSMSDLQSVVAELQDSCIEIQEQRDKSKRDIRIVTTLFLIYVVADIVDTVIRSFFL